MNRERTKGFITGLLVATLVFSLGVPAFAAYQKQATLDYTGVKITLDGKEVVPTDANGKTIEPFGIDGTTYLPVRGIANALGLGVVWDGASQTVRLTSGGGSEDFNTWDAEHTLSSLTFKTPSAWTPSSEDNIQYFYVDKTKAPEKGFLQVLEKDAGTNIASRLDAEVYLSTIADTFAASDTFKNDFSSGPIVDIGNGGWYMNCSYTYSIVEDSPISARLILVCAGDKLVSFNLLIPTSSLYTPDSCAKSLIASLSVSSGDKATSTPTYGERLAAIIERHSNGEYITYSKYSSIRVGMTYIEVAELIGDIGTRSAESDNIVIRQWKTSDGLGVASVTFVDDKVTSKAQAGL